MLKWTKIQSILKKRELVMTFKPLGCMAPELYLTQMFHKTIFFKEASPTEEQFHGKKLNNYYYFYYYFFPNFNGKTSYNKNTYIGSFKRLINSLCF